MEHRLIPQLDISVSRLCLGTVEFGVEYGIAPPGHGNRPPEDTATNIMAAAIDNGINVFDTAPAYGESERIVGAALRELGRSNDVYVATKVGPYAAADVRSETIQKSLEQSLRNLGRERLDIVQIHNATHELLFNSPLMEELEKARQAGKVGVVGASVYGEDAASSALEHPNVVALQVAFNMLDQRMAKTILPLAEKRDVTVLGRSVFLKGVLTDRHEHLPEGLDSLKQLARQAAQWAERHRLSLPEAALRFCLTESRLSTVLIGVSSLEELHSALDACRRGPLPMDLLTEARRLAVTDESLVDPRLWGIP